MKGEPPESRPPATKSKMKKYYYIMEYSKIIDGKQKNGIEIIESSESANLKYILEHAQRKYEMYGCETYAIMPQPSKKAADERKATLEADWDDAGILLSYDEKFNYGIGIYIDANEYNEKHGTSYSSIWFFRYNYDWFHYSESDGAIPRGDMNDRQIHEHAEKMKAEGFGVEYRMLPREIRAVAAYRMEMGRE